MSSTVKLAFKKHAPDYFLMALVWFLVIFGLTMISSVSVFESYTVTKKLDPANPRNDFYLWRDFWHILVSLPVFWVALKIPYRFWKKAAHLCFGASIILLILLFTGFGVKLGGATAWLHIPFLPSIQPAEIAKLGLILYLASWLEGRREELQTLESGFYPFSMIVGTVVLLLVLQPDFGTVLMVVAIALALYYAAGACIKHLLSGLGVSLFLALIVILTVPYVNQRMKVFLDPTIDPKSRNVGWQIQQALIAVGNGGWYGLGFGKSVQKYGYLPEVESDTIFAVSAEELGFLRIGFIVLAFLLVGWRGFQIANRAPDRFAKMAAVGITSWIVFQAFLNIAVNLKIFPLTGITLPFVSYGGSSLVIVIFTTGILLNISQYTSRAYEDLVYRGRHWRTPLS